MTTPTAGTHVTTRPDVRPFHVEVAPDVLADLRRRIAATRWPYPRLVYFHEVDRGDHFAAWQEPELFTTEVRAAFRSLR